MWDKKLCCGLVRDKNISFCPVHCLQFIMYLKQFYKLNTGQLKLFCHVLHFLANQMHMAQDNKTFFNTAKFINQTIYHKRCYMLGKRIHLVITHVRAPTMKQGATTTHESTPPNTKLWTNHKLENTLQIEKSGDLYI